jgi:hypothetical protein
VTGVRSSLGCSAPEQRYSWYKLAARNDSQLSRDSTAGTRLAPPTRTPAADALARTSSSSTSKLSPSPSNPNRYFGLFSSSAVTRKKRSILTSFPFMFSMLVS